MQVADAIAEILSAEGTDHLFAYPVNPLTETCAARDIRTIIVRQERTGVHMADAWSRMHSGERIGVFACQFGPGAENAFGGVAQAWAESVPVLVLPTGYPLPQVGVRPNFSAAAAMAPVAKRTDLLTSARNTVAVMRRAWSALRNGRGGPVVVELPLDVLATGEVPEPLSYRPVVRARSAPDPADLMRAAEVLAAAQRPVIYAGQGVHWARAWPRLRELAELLWCPVTTSLAGKSAFPEDHPLALGSGGRAVPGPVTEFLAEADVILAVGASLRRTPYGVRIPRGPTLIHATVDPDDLQAEDPVDGALLGDADLVLEGLVAELEHHRLPHRDDRRELPERIAARRRAWMDTWMGRLTSQEVPINPYRVVHELGKVLDPERTVITHDAGSPRDQLSPFWVATEPLGYLGWGKSTQLGYGLGLAMGAKLARPDHVCVNVWGDAAIGMTGMDFETAVRERIGILSVLLNNHSMAIEIPVMPVSTAKYRSTDIGGDYAAMARAFGGHGERVTEPDQLAPALRRAIEATTDGIPALVEVITSKETAISTPA